MPDTSSLTGGLFVSTGLIATSLAALIGCITFLFKQVLAAKNDRITDLLTRVKLVEERQERLSEQMHDLTETTIRANTDAARGLVDLIREQHDAVMEHLVALVTQPDGHKRAN